MIIRSIQPLILNQYRSRPWCNSNSRRILPSLKTCRDVRWKSSKENKDSTTVVLSSSDEWIPPNHPLGGDQGQSYMYDEESELKKIELELKELEKEESREKPDTEILADSKNNNNNNNNNSNIQTVDWLQTRRDMLSKSALVKPTDGKTVRDSFVDIPIKEYTLLSKNELIQIVTNLGGTNIQVIESKRLGVDGIILVTSDTYIQRRTIAEYIVKCLKERKLHKRNVIGAILGIDGNIKDPNETWLAINCNNYIVHIFDEKTRIAVNLEPMWTGKDTIFQLDTSNDDDVDQYVSDNPIPDDYNPGGYNNSITSNWNDTLKQLEKSRWNRNK